MIRVIDDLDALVMARGTWDELAVEVGAVPFVRPWFVEPWWRTYGQGRIRVVARSEGGAIVGLAPLHSRLLPGSLQVLRFLGHGQTDGGDLLVADGGSVEGTALKAELIEAALGRSAVARFGLFQLLHCREGGHALDAVGAWEATVVTPDSVCNVIELGDSYWEDRPPLLRRDIEKGERRLAKDGHQASIEIVDDREGLDRTFESIKRVSAAASGSAPDVLAEHDRFMTALLLAAAEAGHLHLALLRLDGEVAAFRISFLTEKTIYSWVSRHHESARRYAPGHLLMQGIVSDALERGVTTIDLLLGDYPYKRLWSTTSYQTFTALGGRSPLMTKVANEALVAIDRLKTRQRERQARTPAGPVA